MIACNVLKTEAVAQLTNYEFGISLALAIERKSLNGETDIRFAKTNTIRFHNDAIVTRQFTVVKRENLDPRYCKCRQICLSNAWDTESNAKVRY